MPSSRIIDLFEAIAQNRARVYNTLVTMSNEDLWRRPPTGKWSIGENLEHLYKASRFARWYVRLILWLKRPLARLRKNNPYVTDIDNIFERPHFHMRAIRINVPQYRIDNPFQLASLQVDLAAEQKHWYRLLRNLPDNIAGNISFPHPIHGTINLLQLLQSFVHHENHHFHAINRILEPAENPKAVATRVTPPVIQ